MRGRFWSFVVGGLVGTVVGLLYAPKSGKENRDDLKDLFDEYVEQGRDNYESQRERVLKAVDTGKEAVQVKSDEIKIKLEEAKDRLKDQVDHVAESAREKINDATKKSEGNVEEN